MNEKKRLFHSFFSLFDKDSISKQDFDKLKQFDIFLPNSFLIHFERTIFQIQDQENQAKIQEKEKKIKRRDKRIKSFESEKKKKEKENQKKEEENQNLKSENEKKDKILKQKDEEIQNLKLSFEKEIEKEKQKIKEIQKEESNQNENKLLKILPQFSDSEIIKDIEYVKKLQEWINDNDFFSKMKKGYSAKRDGFDCDKWHSICDNKGKTLVIIKTKDNFIFGGFTQIGWTNDKSKWREEDRNNDYGYIPDSNSFIFSLRNDKGDRNSENFGGGDIELYSDLQSGDSNFGESYNLPNGIKKGTNEARSYLAGSL
ncbi:hypothetical protein M0811_04614 [Anaeramoeba ignava]|uniref:TLDc domain-containing protein n=1 Tax=Anaeramoeba ignava TaxID=1746090 RepID=A0A9Q0LS88_ANAIG|nr:hypothetical protein M0811_04614 [Anaeramoeba ignava]